MRHKPYILAWLLVLALVTACFAEWNEKVLYSFQDGTDGATPVGGVVFDTAGNLYGATMYGGSSDCPPGWCGTVYELSPPTQKGGNWTEQVLHIFGGYYQGDGAMPSGGLIMDKAGNLYGVTGYGGSGPCILFGTLTGCGAVYELSPPQQQGGAWTETILYSFQGGNDGDFAQGSLVFDSAGDLYGATQFGGGQGTTCDGFYGGNCGTVFELSPPQNEGGQWTEKVLHSFAGIAQGEQYGDGAEPNGTLVLDTAGAIYGTTFHGGYNCPNTSGLGCGTVFMLKVQRDGKWMQKQIHVFKNGLDGTEPDTGVLLASDDSLYGGAGGGSKGGGIVFRLRPISSGQWSGAILYGFSTQSYGYSPSVSGFDKTGNLYGVTQYGLGLLDGTVWRLSPPSQPGSPWTGTLLYDFLGGTDTGFPTPMLAVDSKGNIYGASAEGGGKGMCQGYCGTVFEITP